MGLLNENKPYQYPMKEETLILAPTTPEVKYQVNNEATSPVVAIESLQYKVFIESKTSTTNKFMFSIISESELNIGEMITDNVNIFFITDIIENDIIVKNLIEQATQVKKIL